MTGRWARSLARASVAAILCTAAAGCIQSTIDVPEVFQEPDLPVTAPHGQGWWDCATFRLARGGRVQIILFRALGERAAEAGAAQSLADESAGADASAEGAAPAAPAMPDSFEYLYFELPERPHSGWIRRDRLPAWRWVRLAGPDGRVHDRVWRGEEGKADLRFGIAKKSLRADLRVVMRAALGDASGYILGGTVVLDEDVARTQGYANVYNPKLEALLAEGE